MAMVTMMSLCIAGKSQDIKGSGIEDMVTHDPCNGKWYALL